MTEITREQFTQEIEELNSKKTTYNFESQDSGSVYFAMGGCSISVNLEDGIDGEITVFKPYAQMEVSIDFSIVDSIYKENDEYYLEFSNGMADVIIKPLQKAE